MKFRFKKAVGLMGLALAFGLVFDAALFSADAEACVFGGQKCRQRKAKRLTAKSEAACSQDPNSRKCLRISNRLEKVLGRKNMKGYVRDQKLDTSQVSLAHQMRMKFFCEKKGLRDPMGKDRAECQAAYNNRMPAGNSGWGSTSSHGKKTTIGSGTSNAVRF